MGPFRIEPSMAAVWSAPDHRRAGTTRVGGAPVVHLARS